MGHCMNPECHTDLHSGGTFIGEIAHIVPNAHGGDVAYGNLLVLCRNCHRIVDDQRTSQTEEEMSRWKRIRNREIRKRFTKRYDSFEELSDHVVPILERNRSIFDSYGPINNGASAHHMWLSFEAELLANNQKLVDILNKNKELLHFANQEIVERFTTHAHEFKETRRDRSNPRRILFPAKLNSIFGVERVSAGLTPNVSALQNMIEQLIRDGEFVDLDLEEEQVLVYRENDSDVVLHLNDRPRVDQILWSRRCYRPQTTSLRLDGLLFTLNWLRRRGFEYRIPNLCELGHIRLEDGTDVIFVYEYCLSASHLYKIDIDEEMLIVNLYNWNGGVISEDAESHAEEFGAVAMNQREFFRFCHRNLK